MVRFLKKENSSDSPIIATMKQAINHSILGLPVGIPKEWIELFPDSGFKKLGSWYNEINTISNKFI